MEKKLPRREARAREALNAYCAAYVVLQEPTPERALLVLLLKALHDSYDYVTFALLQRSVDITEQGLKIMIGRLKGDGLVIEDNGFIALTGVGLGYARVLVGKTSLTYEKHKKKRMREKK